MTSPSVSEEMIRAAIPAATRAFNAAWFGKSRAERIRAALDAALPFLAHLSAGSEAVKPVAWQLQYEDGWSDHLHEEVQADAAIRKWPSVVLGKRPLYAANVQDEPEWPDLDTDDSDIALVAKAIAENGFGRPWDDFLACNAHDTDQNDLIEYATAAVIALRSKQAPTVAVPDEGVETGEFGTAWQTSYTGELVWHFARKVSFSSIDLERGIVRNVTPLVRARAEQRETPSAVVVGETVIAAFNAMWIRPPTADDYWKVVPSSGKPLLYGARYQGLLAHGTIATWKEFDFIVAVVNAMIDARAAAPTSDGG